MKSSMLRIVAVALLISILAFFAARHVNNSFLALGTEVRVPIIVYHHIRPYSPEKGPPTHYEVTPEVFEQQLQYLARHGYRTISLDAFKHALRNQATTSLEQAVVLTFDDGWKNQHEHAFPLLKKYDMQGTFYVSAELVGNNGYVTWDDLRDMDQAGMTIGSHGLGHPDFHFIKKADARGEIADSKKLLEEKLGKKVSHFAAPYGFIDDTLETLIRRSGYETARSGFQGTTNSLRSIHKLRSIYVPTTLEGFVSIFEGQ